MSVCPAGGSGHGIAGWLPSLNYTRRPFSATIPPRSGSNAQLDFPCLDASEQRTQRYQISLESGPEPSYSSSPEGVQTWHSSESLTCDYGGHLPSFDIAYESWGTLNADKSNVILLHTGLSASSHAHSTPENTQPGWWEKYIGPGKPLDTDHFYIICTNVLGGCFGSTGPRSLDPADGQPYATRFPILTLNDMLRAQFKLLDHLGIFRLFASIGSSMGGMQSLAAATLFPNRVGAVVSISGCAKSHPYSIALRHSQRQIIMADANWSRGFYYDKVLPHAGMKLARQIATISYRSGPEWEHRFGSRRANETLAPAFCPDFLVETYLDHAGEKFIGSYDPNSLLYVSKAMDLFNLSGSYQQRLAQLQQAGGFAQQADLCRTAAYPEQPDSTTISGSAATATIRQSAVKDLAQGMQSMRETPTLVVGVQSDNLMPVSCQREIADALRETGNMDVQYSELSLEQSHFGHDTFLLSEEVGQYVREFLTRRRIA
ncbi:Alpha/Beta hydrolase protein [Protomyces lactucae-debilis]|uniref:Alpha/Beta hydrolase protein n=1 Tax=Protomyces lactucae-debilis TaxID=2754530 RepID=A0A1Y2FC67_PROLT|nr:Alpha/Beta hydrolase protein [Protomyces lactucae-debilis]ORY81503.1 Alpha/Beta hydrolase protein [Protomyces lactucae-debilis]